MPWKPGEFKGAKVWFEVDDRGVAKVASGRVRMRYSDRPGAKVYQAAAANVRVDDAAAAIALDAGGAAGAAGGGASRGSGFGKAGTRTEEQKGLAADAARRLLADLPAGTAIAYTDGACRGNPGPAGSGARLELPDGRVGEASAALGRATNNVAELTAIGLAIDLLEQVGWPVDAPVALLTDSSYAHGVLCRGWKAKANGPLIAELRERLAARPALVVHWVAGHVGVGGNERADALANAGVSGVDRTVWSPALDG